jgi:hypothetical protein
LALWKEKVFDVLIREEKITPEQCHPGLDPGLPTT